MITMIYGPKGREMVAHGESLRLHFGKKEVNWWLGKADMMAEDVLYLAHHDLDYLKNWNGGLLFQAPYVQLMSIDEALLELASTSPLASKKPQDILRDIKKDTNPKDAIGIRKWRMISTLSWTVLAEVAVAMFEGAVKYGRHNYRVAGVRSSVYVDAAVWHIGQWWEGEDIDKDSGLSHITKAIASLFVLRDAMIQDMLSDDRPPKGNLDQTREHLQKVVDEILAKYPEPKVPYTEKSLT